MKKLGNSVNECSSIIRLHEKDDLNGTDAALKLIGKEVPVQLVVAYNDFNVISSSRILRYTSSTR